MKIAKEASGYVSVDHTINFLFSDLNKEGRVVCTILLTNEYADEYAALEPLAQAWDDEYVELRFRFPLKSILDLEIEGHRLFAFEDRVCMDRDDSKPLFDAIRAELAAMIERIDAIEYRADEAATNPVLPPPAP